MNGRLAAAVAIGSVALTSICSAQNASLEIPQAMLNTIVARLGALSNAGVYQPTMTLMSSGVVQNCQPFGVLECPASAGQRRMSLVLCKDDSGAPMLMSAPIAVTWQWWVTNASFTLTDGAMTFTATVRTLVGGQTNTVTLTAPSSVSLESGANRLRVTIGPMVVPVQSNGTTVTAVDVAKLYGLSIPIEPQHLSLALPSGGTRNLIARVVSITPKYLPGKLVVNVDVAF
jgi:hypothetical protein